MAADVPLALLRRSTTVRPAVPGRAAAVQAAALPGALVETPRGSQVASAGSVTSAEPNGSVLVLDPQSRQFVSVTDTGVGVLPATAAAGLALSV